MESRLLSLSPSDKLDPLQASDYSDVVDEGCLNPSQDWLSQSGTMSTMTEHDRTPGQVSPADSFRTLEDDNSLPTFEDAFFLDEDLHAWTLPPVERRLDDSTPLSDIRLDVHKVSGCCLAQDCLNKGNIVSGKTANNKLKVHGIELLLCDSHKTLVCEKRIPVIGKDGIALLPCLKGHHLVAADRFVGKKATCKSGHKGNSRGESRSSRQTQTRRRFQTPYDASASAMSALSSFYPTSASKRQRVGPPGVQPLGLFVVSQQAQCLPPGELFDDPRVSHVPVTSSGTATKRRIDGDRA